MHSNVKLTLVILATLSSGHAAFADEFERWMPESNPGEKMNAEYYPIKVMQKPKYNSELFAIGVVILFIINLIFGKLKNESIANAWLKEFKHLFEDNFSEVGMGSIDSDGGLITESWDSFKYYASGRFNCSGIVVELNTKRRQDLFSVLYGLVFPSDDELNIEIPMASEHLESFIVCVCPKKKTKANHIEAQDLSDFTSVIKHDRVCGKVNKKNIEWPPQLSVLTDYVEGLSTIFTSDIVQILSSNHKLVKLIHITDQRPKAGASVLVPEGITTDKSLRFQFKLPSSTTDMASLEPLMNLVFQVLDNVSKVHLSKPAQEKAMKLRAKAKKRHSKVNDKDEKKLAREAKAEEDFSARQKWLASLPSEKRLKEEQREEKKLLRRRQKAAGGTTRLR